jgi:hypothetical protein
MSITKSKTSYLSVPVVFHEIRMSPQLCDRESFRAIDFEQLREKMVADPKTNMMIRKITDAHDNVFLMVGKLNKGKV